ncbi:tetracycline transporter [Drepanopeziza brunnea f. sp. 'multigermtubi' MB_m1]|uniref:Tetracycline transporter n=1 Tax=Marssonina brunnea f. sp. multigermtubi (strain MB_m1) TaxID=1072389 RepID=K1WBD3_MARBU|nr:tetracycline transporter [Drepanopeziza brunnea f. sp. 'multigermtubi' MB_m1]EKD14625.1 tetracycline transporter [Drepanopeziza brunnea f. sp. 'multigermtubi' MB_m1]
MPKEKSVNPAQAQRKAEKAKAIKKGKAEQQSRRNEKLAKRNPYHLEKELADLKSLEKAGTLTAHEKTLLEATERDLKAVKKAREALGDAAPNEESDVPEDVKRIPMPRDTPPPIPKEILDRWYQKRRERIAERYPDSTAAAGAGSAKVGTSANNVPLGANERRVGGGGSGGQEMPKRVFEEAKTTYEAKPVIRDLRKEATSFVPAAVRMKLDKVRGVGGLVEPEEADVLERAGYLGKKAAGEERGGEEGSAAPQGSRAVRMEEVDDEDG